jgi:protein-disulfide isomerase
MKFRFATAAALALSLLSPIAFAQEAAVTPAQKTEIEKIVHDYLVEHPEVIREAIQALQAKEEQLEQDARSRAAVANKDLLANDPDSPVVGNPMGDVTVVEFFDYHCPYCKVVAGPLQKLLEEDKGVRLVLKEFPILGEDSRLAARAALAATRQGKYWQFHQALMEYRGKFDMPVLRSIATKAGLDPAKLEADMGADTIDPMLAANRKLAEALDLSATPTFIIGDQVIEGAVPLEELKEAIKKARGS